MVFKANGVESIGPSGNLDWKTLENKVAMSNLDLSQVDFKPAKLNSLASTLVKLAFFAKKINDKRIAKRHLLHRPGLTIIKSKQKLLLQSCSDLWQLQNKLVKWTDQSEERTT